MNELWALVGVYEESIMEGHPLRRYSVHGYNVLLYYPGIEEGNCLKLTGVKIDYI